jgi:hypothetical protein
VPIETLTLSVRVRSIVRRLRVRTLGELCQLSVDEILSGRSFGMTTMQELFDQLRARGLRFRDDKAGPCIMREKRPRVAGRDWSTVPVAEFDPWPLALYILEGLNVTTVAELARLPARELWRRTFYQAVYDELTEVLVACGLRTKGEPGA